MKLLFLLKKNLIYGSYNSVIAKSGLLNSAQITAHQLHKHLGVETSIEICVDGNDVDKFLHRHKPKVCIIEAIWVTPAKLIELVRLHRRVKFIILIHSEVPFLSSEGNAIEWIKQYDNIQNVFPAFNSLQTFEQFTEIGIGCLHLPNIYFDVEKKKDRWPFHHGIMNLGLFGAIRPFKNQLLQAMAAIVAADKNGWTLHLHMNTTRTEQGGESVLKNIRALFEGTTHTLVEHDWGIREGFLHLISTMDLGLQVSFSESFNIVAADFVLENCPIVVSPTIDWMPDSQKADPEDLFDIVSIIEKSIINRKAVVKAQIKHLNKYNKSALEYWKDFLKNHYL